MKSIRLLATFAVALTAMSASALTITQLGGIDGGNINSVTDLNNVLNPDAPAGEQMWYKTDGGGTHQPDFSNNLTGNNDFSVTLHYEGGTPRPDINYAALKAGNFFLVFSITGWAGEDIVLNQNVIMNPPKNAYLGISHAALFGTPGAPIPPTSVPTPDGGATAALLGAGSLALAALRKALR